MRHYPTLISLCLAALALSGCENTWSSAPPTDTTIKLMPWRTGEGYIVVPPECPSWRTVSNGPFENEPWPQYGCAHARNLAAMIEDPKDLIETGDTEPGNAETTANATLRYRTDKTKALIDPNAKAPVPQNVTTQPLLGGITSAR